jgi:thiamine biosynthesis lipoprotein
VKRRAAAALAAAAAAAVCVAALSLPREWRYGAAAMGTRAELTIVGSAFEMISGRTGGAATKALAEIAAIERLMSIYRAGSDIARLNGGGAEVEVDPRTFEVLTRAAEISRLTGGAFNVCVLPAEEAWGFKTGGMRAVPDEPVRVSGGIALREEPGGFLARAEPRGTRVDLGGIAAGYAADRAAHLLRAEGVRGALVDIGGDVYCLGMSARGAPWRVGIRHPRSQGVLLVLDLSDRAIATSGDYEDCFIRNGKRYSHIFDPRTGRPAERGVASATIVADSCVVADALGTALVVMGAPEALRLVERLPRTECILVTDEEGGPRVHASSGMRDALPALMEEGVQAAPR